MDDKWETWELKLEIKYSNIEINELINKASEIEKYVYKEANELKNKKETDNIYFHSMETKKNRITKKEELEEYIYCITNNLKYPLTMIEELEYNFPKMIIEHMEKNYKYGYNLTLEDTYISSLLIIEYLINKCIFKDIQMKKLKIIYYKKALKEMIQYDD